MCLRLREFPGSGSEPGEVLRAKQNYPAVVASENTKEATHLARPRLVDQAMALLGPLEARIMQLVWEDKLPEPFIVHDVHEKLPRLAYTTVMTTVHRLADKGLLSATRLKGVRAHQYREELSPREFLNEQGGLEIDDLIARYGDTALAAFAARLEQISPERRERLRRLGGR